MNGRWAPGARRLIVPLLLLGACASVPAVAQAAPVATITAQPSTGANDGLARFEFTSNGGSGTTFECRRDGPAWTACSSPKTYTGLGDGGHTFDVRARDGTGPGPGASVSWQVEPLTGMSYENWYVNRGNYIWRSSHGTGSTKQFLADVNHDGLDDAVAFYNQSSEGRWSVATSNGNGFGAPSTWATGVGGWGQTNALMGDVNGDGSADAVAFADLGVGIWEVATSNGVNGFNPPQQWATGHGANSTNQMLGDVNGDHWADAITYDSAGGNWYVALAKKDASPPGFGPRTLWKSGFGAGTTDRFVADVNGDGAADAIVFGSQYGAWAVALSCAPTPSPCGPAGSNTFGTPAYWLTGFGTGATTAMVGDVGRPNGIGGDGKADAVLYGKNVNRTGQPVVWQRAVSDGSRFVPPDPTHDWKEGPNSLSTRTVPLLGNVDGQLQDAAGTYPASDDPVIYAEDEGGGLLGQWKFLPAEGFIGNSEPPVSVNGVYTGESYRPYGAGMWNKWQAPTVSDTNPARSLAVAGWSPLDGRYDSFDAGVIDSHLRSARDAKIDFLIGDETNGLFTGGKSIWHRAERMCQRIKALRPSEPRIPRFAADIGDLGKGTPNNVYLEAQNVYNLLAANPQCGALDSTGIASGYMQLEGKPLIVIYLEAAAKDQLVKQSPTEWGYISSHFTVRWHQGAVEPPLPTGWEDYYGSVFADGAIYSPKTMVTMPGWDPPYDSHRTVKRAVPEQGKQFYDVCAWQRVLAQSPRPDVVVVNSYNDYFEQTAVAPTNAPSEAAWQGPSYYWNQTKAYNSQRKALSSGPAPSANGCNH